MTTLDAITIGIITGVPALLWCAVILADWYRPRCRRTR